MKIDGVELQKLAEQTGQKPEDYTPLERRLIGDLVELYFVFSSLRTRVALQAPMACKEALEKSLIVYEKGAV